MNNLKFIFVILIAIISLNKVSAQLDDDFAISPNAIGHFEYYQNRAIFPSTKNEVRNEEMWQFRYFPLFIPRVDENGKFVIEYDQLDEDTWFVYLHLWRDNNKSKELAFNKISEIYRNELKTNTGKFVDVKKIKASNIYAIPVSQVQVISIDGIPKDVIWSLAKTNYSSIGTSGLLKLKLKVQSEKEAKSIIDKSRFLDIRLAFDIKSKKVKFNSCNIAYKDLQQSKLYESLNGVGSEGYVHRNDLRELVKNVTKEININCTVEEGSRYQAELEIYQNILTAWGQNQENVEFSKIEFDKTYNSDDLKPDVYEKNLNEFYDKIHTINSISNDKKNTLKLSIPIPENPKIPLGIETDQSKKRELTENILKENRIKAEWNGEKYIPKSIALIRYNLAVFEKEGNINSSIQYVSDSDLGKQTVDVEYDNFSESKIQSYSSLNTRISKLEEDLSNLSNSHKAVIPIGTIISFSTDYVEGTLVDWLPCDGRSLSIEKYPTLFNQIGYAWGGEGDEFNLPNLNGQFLRGLDKKGQVDKDHANRIDIKGVEVGGVVGSYQIDATKNANNKFKTEKIVDNDMHVAQYQVQNPMGSNRNVTHLVNRNKWGGWVETGEGGDAGNRYGLRLLGRDGTTAKDYNLIGGDLETRPVNVYVQFLIKIQ